jgi:hypothetical protein
MISDALRRTWSGKKTFKKLTRGERKCLNQVTQLSPDEIRTIIMDRIYGRKCNGPWIHRYLEGYTRMTEMVWKELCNGKAETLGDAEDAGRWWG